jgi:hypothetical protein
VRTLLRIVAIAGLVVGLALAAGQDVSTSRPLEGLASSIVLAAAIALLALLPREARTVLRHGDLLVPLTLALIADSLVVRLGATAALGFLSRGAHVELGGFAVVVSASLAFSIVVATVAAAWTTRLVLAAVTGREVDLLNPLPSLLHASGVTFLVCLLGCGVTIGVVVLLGLALPLLELSKVSFVVGAGLAALLLAFWCVATAPLLPVALAPAWPTTPRLRAGFAAAARHARRWALPVVLQFVLLGSVTYSETQRVRVERRRSRETVTVIERWDVKTNVAWTGAYASESHWIPSAAAAEDVEPAASLSLLARLACLGLAVAVKLRVASAISEPAREARSSPPSRAVRV